MVGQRTLNPFILVRIQVWQPIMEKSLFPYPKLNLPRALKDSKVHIESFRDVENYIDSVAPFIYTDIDLNPASPPSQSVRSWIQKIMSASLVRSLYIRNAVVDSINSRNIVGLYLGLKAWLEVVGLLAFILEMFEKRYSDDDLFKKVKPLALGNRGKGNLRIGSIEATNVLSLLESANRYVSNLKAHSSYGKQADVINTFFTDYYDTASNPTHPSFDAHELVGHLVPDKEGIWQVYDPDVFKENLSKELPQYGGLLMAATFIPHICQQIYDIEGERLRTLGSKLFFT